MTLENKILGLVFIAGIAGGVSVGIAHYSGKEIGFEQGIRYRACLSEVDSELRSRREKGDITGRSYQEFESLRNKCEEEYGLK